jgi:lipopolysaccharide transport system permease protein
VSLLPERHRWLLALNPVSGIVEAFRAALFGHRPLPWPQLGAATLTTALVLASGLFYFRRVERSFADVI